MTPPAPPPPGSRTVTREAAVGEILTRVVVHLREAGPSAWARYFMPEFVTGADSELIDALNEWHRRETRRGPGSMDAFAAPRGHAKTTAGVEIPALFHAANCTRTFQIITSATYSQAVDRIATIVEQVENNPKLRAAYPDLVPALDKKGQLVRWRDDDVVFKCGCRIMAAGAGRAIRGARQGATRPDLIYFDDLETEESVATEASLEKRLKWITRVALGLADARTGISALWVGTILTRTALLNQATGAALDEGQQRPEWARSWTSHVFAAERRGTAKKPTVVVDVEEDPQTGVSRRVVRNDADGKPLTYQVGEPLWSELTRTDLARIRYKLGAASYAAEYLSDPVEAGTSILARPRDADYLNPHDPIEARLVRLPGGRVIPVSSMTIAAALDPQYAVPGAGTDPDLAAIVVAGAYAGDTFLLDCWVGRDRHGQASRLVDMAVKWGAYAAGVEAVAAQTLTADEAALDGRMPIVPIKRPATGGGKAYRALPLAARLGDKGRPETCRVWVLPDAAKEGPHGALADFLERFPNGRYDDPVDATIDAVHLANIGVTAEGGSGRPGTRGRDE